MTQYWKIAGVLIVVVLFLQGCKDDKQTVEARKPPEPIAKNITAEAPTRMSLFNSKETDGNIVAERSVDVVSKGMGECTKMLVEEGDVVKEGQVIAELDQEELQAQLLNSRLTVEQKKYQYDITKAEYDDKTVGTASKFDLKNAEMAWKLAQASLKVQEVQLKNQSILAPISGIVVRKNIQKGMMVTQGAPVVKIVDPSSYFLQPRIPERDLGKLQEGQAAEVFLDALGDAPFPTTVRRIEHDIEGGFVTLIMDFREEDRPKLREGAYARVQLIVETHEDALVVPKDAVLQEGGRTHVLVVRDVTPAAPEEGETPPETPAKAYKIAEKVYVEVGLENSNFIEILSGIAESDQIVTLGQFHLEPGARVKVSSVENELQSRADMTPEEALEKANQERAAKPEERS